MTDERTSPMIDKLPQAKRRAHRTGTVVAIRKNDRTLWAARILLKDGERKQIRCPVGFTRKQAEARAQEWQAKEDATHGLYLGKQKATGIPVGGETADAWFTRMLPIRAAAIAVKDTPELRTRWKVWVSPLVGKKPLAAISRADLLQIRDALDNARAIGRLQPKTTLNIWSCVCTAFRVACSTKGWARALKVLEVDPTLGIEPPDDGPSRKRQWLYPNEFAKLMNCDAVPAERQYLYMCAAFTGLRPEELVELRWKDVDFAANVIRVSRAFDWKARTIGKPKTEAAIRPVPIEAHLRPLLEARMGSPEEFVAPRFDDHHAADGLREDLKTAGVSSLRLFEKTATHLPVDFRCLRDTYATWSRLRRDAPDLIMARLGHEDIKTTFKYTKVAETVSGDVGVPFALSSEVEPLKTAGVTPRVTEVEFPVEKQRREWDSNPRYSFPYASLARMCLRPLGHLSKNT
jgi:integrase